MYRLIVNQLKRFLPVYGIGPAPMEDGVEKYITLSLQRSGQHAVINWLCSNIDNIIHFNHCRFERKILSYSICPINRRAVYYRNSVKEDSGIQDDDRFTEFMNNTRDCRNILYSFEDKKLDNIHLNKYITSHKPKVIIILRDPYNWLASSIKHKKSSKDEIMNKKGILITYLEQALKIKQHIPSEIYTINYNKWTIDESYKNMVLKELGINKKNSSNRIVEGIPDFGGGSSFSGTSSDLEELRSKVFQRWKDYKDDFFYQELLSDPYLEKLTEKYFKMEKPF